MCRDKTLISERHRRNVLLDRAKVDSGRSLYKKNMGD